REIAVADLAALGRTHHAGFADRERRGVVVKDEGLAALAGEAVDDLRIAGGAERGNDQPLRLATREERRTVGGRQNAYFHGDRTHRGEIASIDTRIAVENLLANQIALELEEFGIDLLFAPPGRIAGRERCHRLALHFRELIAAFEFVADGVGLSHR